jgi:hypothetical protein
MEPDPEPPNCIEPGMHDVSSPVRRPSPACVRETTYADCRYVGFLLAKKSKTLGFSI